MEFGHDPKNYREVSKPLEDAEKANDALKAFFSDVGDLRNKHHIADVHVIARVNALYDGAEGVGLSSCHYGNTLLGAQMCAWSLGKENTEQRKMISLLVAGNKLDVPTTF